MDLLKKSPGMSRYVRAEAASPFARGEIIGRSAPMQIRPIGVQDSIICKKGDFFRESGFLPHGLFIPYIEKHAPDTWLEMQGTAEGAGLDFDDLLILA
jgi:hypothetical protein